MKALLWILIGAVVLLVVFALLMALPAIHIDADEVIASNAYSYIRAACYFLPMGTVTAILSIIMGLWVFRVIIALVKTIWSVLPVGGGGGGSGS